MYIFLRIFIIKQGSSYLNSVLCFIPPLEYFFGIRAQSVQELRNMNMATFMVGVRGGNGTEVDSNTLQPTSTITPTVTS